MRKDSSLDVSAHRWFGCAETVDEGSKTKSNVRAEPKGVAVSVKKPLNWLDKIRNKCSIHFTVTAANPSDPKGETDILNCRSPLRVLLGPPPNQMGYRNGQGQKRTSFRKSKPHPESYQGYSEQDRGLHDSSHYI